MSSYTNMLKGHVDRLQGAARDKMAQVTVGTPEIQPSPKVTVGAAEIQPSARVSVGQAQIQAPAPREVSLPAMTLKADNPWDKVLSAYRSNQPVKVTPPKKVEVPNPMRQALLAQAKEVAAPNAALTDPMGGVSALHTLRQYWEKKGMKPLKLEENLTWPPSFDASAPNGALGYAPYQKHLVKIADRTMPAVYQKIAANAQKAAKPSDDQAYQAATQKAGAQLAAGQDDGAA